MARIKISWEVEVIESYSKIIDTADLDLDMPQELAAEIEAADADPEALMEVFRNWDDLSNFLCDNEENPDLDAVNGRGVVSVVNVDTRTDERCERHYLSGYTKPCPVCEMD